MHGKESPHSKKHSADQKTDAIVSILPGALSIATSSILHSMHVDFRNEDV